MSNTVLTRGRRSSALQTCSAILHLQHRRPTTCALPAEHAGNHLGALNKNEGILWTKYGAVPRREGGL